MDKNSKGSDGEPSFQQKVWMVCGITALFVVLIWFFIVTFNVFLLILAGALIALFFHGFAELIQRKLHLQHKASLLISIISTFVIIALLFWFMGAKIQEQVTELAKTLPATISNAKRQLSTTALGQKIVEKTTSEDVYNKGYAFVGKFFNSTFGVFTDIYIVLFLGLFFTIAPKTYINGFLALMPKQAKQRAKYTIERIGFTLTKWLKGQIFAMIIAAILKGIALTILDIPMAIALALIAGILNFIPNFGSLISMFPAILIALTIGINKAIIVTLVYLVIQIFEGNVIAPSIQQKLINMPAAIVIIAQLFIGLFAGVWGLILATPIVAIVMVVIQETYVKKINS
ncbi:MAG: family transporter [Segetibacter sp.]|nr:family transporter [Segetibacter sp.]